MPLDLDVIGRPQQTPPVSWESRDPIIYALGVGAGYADPCDELEYTTEQGIGGSQRVLPTYVSLFGAKVPEIGPFDRTALLHAGQGVQIVRPLPVRGTLNRTMTVTAIHDLGNGALVCSQTRLEAPSGVLYGLATSEFFIRGEGGFGGERPQREPDDRPQREPDAVLRLATAPSQALLYRLSGDLNPIHADPAVAGAAGFDRPILHGLCTFGLAGRALLREFVGDGERLESLRGRFTSPVWPGETLRVDVWRDGRRAWFRVSRDGGVVVFDRGVAAKGPA